MPFWLKLATSNCSFLLFGWSMWPPPNVTDLPGIIAHFGVRDPVWQSFCAAVGDCGPDIRPLANLPPTLVTQSITAARLEGGRRLTPLEAIQVGMIYRACHRQVHLSKGLPLEIWVDPDPWTTSLPSSSTSTGPGTSPSTTSMERKLKFAQVIDQSDESEFLVSGGAPRRLRGPLHRSDKCFGEEGDPAQTTTLLRFCSIRALCQETSKGTKIPELCPSRRRHISFEDGTWPRASR